jgi:hypothetical protein
MFKVGDRVRCVTNEDAEDYLRQGEVYRVTSVIDDEDKSGMEIRVNGNPCQWSYSRFVLADEPQPILVPVDSACVPDGEEFVRVGRAKKGERYYGLSGTIVEALLDHTTEDSVSIIVRRKWQSSVSIPKGWWVFANNDQNVWRATDVKPDYDDGTWICSRKAKWDLSLNGLNFTPPEDGQPRQVT